MGCEETSTLESGAGAEGGRSLRRRVDDGVACVAVRCQVATALEGVEEPSPVTRCESEEIERLAGSG